MQVGVPLLLFFTFVRLLVLGWLKHGRLHYSLPVSLLSHFDSVEPRSLPDYGQPVLYLWLVLQVLIQRINQVLIDGDVLREHRP